MLAGFGQAFLGKTECLGSLFQRQHGLGGGAMETKFGRLAFHKPLESDMRLVHCAALAMHLPAAQFVIVVVPAVVLFVIGLLAGVDISERLIRLGLVQCELNQTGIEGITVGAGCIRRPCNQSLGKPAGDFTSGQLVSSPPGLCQLIIRQCFDRQVAQPATPMPEMSTAAAPEVPETAATRSCSPLTISGGVAETGGA